MTLYFFLEDDFVHVNRVLMISSYFFLVIIMCTHNGNFPQWIGRLFYLVSIVATDELALQGARVSAIIELSISPQWNISILATEALHWDWY